MKVMLADANAEALEAAHDAGVATLTRRPDDVRAFVDRRQPARATSSASGTQAYEAFGEVAVLMNNAGIGGGGGFSATAEKWRAHPRRQSLGRDQRRAGLRARR